MDSPLVTLIVPGRDIDEYAPAALASILALEHERWRAILVDDGSMDATGDIFRHAARNDPRFTVITHREPHGLGAARNAALAHVDTPYLGFLDADDELTPRGISRLLATLEHTRSDFAVGAYVRLRPQQGRYVPGQVQPWIAHSTNPERHRLTLAEHPAVTANIVAWSKLSRTEFWHNRRFPENVAYEDQIVAQQMYTQGTFDVIRDVIVRWRVREDGSSITQNKGKLPVLRDYLAALRGGIRVLVEAGATEAVTARIALILAMDIPPLQEIARSHENPEYARALEEFLAELKTLPGFDDARPDPTLRDALNW